MDTNLHYLTSVNSGTYARQYQSDSWVDNLELILPRTDFFFLIEGHNRMKTIIIVYFIT